MQTETRRAKSEGPEAEHPAPPQGLGRVHHPLGMPGFSQAGSSRSSGGQRFDWDFTGGLNHWPPD